jgi:hypothetical protein
MTFEMSPVPSAKHAVRGGDSVGTKGLLHPVTKLHCVRMVGQRSAKIAGACPSVVTN